MCGHLYSLFHEIVHLRSRLIFYKNTIFFCGSASSPTTTTLQFVSENAVQPEGNIKLGPLLVFGIFLWLAVKSIKTSEEKLLIFAFAFATVIRVHCVCCVNICLFSPLEYKGGACSIMKLLS